jgi:hypothetical protein
LAALSTLAALLSALAGLLGLLPRLLAALLPAALLPAALLPAVLTTLARLLRLLARPLTRVLIGVVHWERSCVRLVQAFNTGERQLFRLERYPVADERRQPLTSAWRRRRGRNAGSA